MKRGSLNFQHAGDENKAPSGVSQIFQCVGNDVW